MEESDVTAKIIEIAGGEAGQDELLEMTAATVHSDLYDAAIDAFGTWDAALAAALVSAVTPSRRQTYVVREEEAVERKVKEEARDPIYTVTTEGHFFWIDGEELDVTERPDRLETPPEAGVMKRMIHLGEPDGVFLFSNHGRYFGLDPRLLPQWMGPSDLKRLEQMLPMESDESIQFLLPRRVSSDGRYIHITRQAKGKATDSAELGRTLDRSGREAFLLNEGDDPIAVLHGPEANSVFCASAMGQGIHFDAGDLRTMGRRAVGVNVMKLDGPEDEVVGAFLGNGVEQLAVITERGMGKRVWFEEFRQQGRAGAGMQLARLDTGDRVAAIAACLPGKDLVVMTSAGRVHRMPTTTFDMMGRPAKGNRMIELADDEIVIGLDALPCGSE